MFRGNMILENLKINSSSVVPLHMKQYEQLKKYTGQKKEEVKIQT